MYKYNASMLRGMSPYCITWEPIPYVWWLDVLSFTISYC
eukprot:Gb_24754 [translate_table: standard]